MSNLHPVAYERHGNLRWRRPKNAEFAAKNLLAPLVAVEFPKAVFHMPVAFIEIGEAFLPFAVQGLTQGKNLYVSPAGEWVGGYVPAVYRAYPFQLAKIDAEQIVLCIDEASGLLGTDGETIFNNDGQPANAVRDTFDFLMQIENNRAATAKACAVLQKYQLIQPWPLAVKEGDESQQIEGLCCIDETALNRIAPDAMIEIRDAGALSMAYCQLLSMHHMPMLVQRAEVRKETDTRAELAMEFLNNGGTISFGDLG